MSFWEEFRSQVMEHTTASDITLSLYRKIATTGANELALIKPSHHLGQLSVRTMDYIQYVEDLLKAPEGDLGVDLQYHLYIREWGKSLLADIAAVGEPMEGLIQELEELYGGDEFDEDDEESEAEEDGSEPPTGEDAAPRELAEAAAAREELSDEKDKLEEAIRVRLRKTGSTDRVAEELAARMADVYLECVQFARELKRMSAAPSEDLDTILSILVDIQFGVDFRLRYLLMEDLTMDGEAAFTPGLLTWNAMHISELMDRVFQQDISAGTH